MQHREFISQLDEQRIVRAIGDVEKTTSGEIRVCLSRKERHDALAFAQKRFRQLGMFKTRHRNAILIYIVPRTRQFAVLGDVGIHQKCGEEFWKQIARGMSAKMKERKFTEAIVEAIQTAGRALQQHFPATRSDTNELSDAIARD